MARIFFDVSELVANPVRTGIQRLTLELLRRWPEPDELVPGVTTSEGMLRLPETAVALLRETFRRDPGAVSMSELAAQSVPLRPQEVEATTAFLHPEVTYDAVRCRLYHRLAGEQPDRLFMIGYDFLPWLRTDLFPPGTASYTMVYLRTLRHCAHVAFISEASRDAFVRRIRRIGGGDVVTIRPGSDGLGREDPEFDPSRRGFAVVATVEPRKDHELVLDAFESLWRGGIDVSLTFAGRDGAASPDLLSRIDQLERRQPLFRRLRSLDDQGVRAVVRDARATIYPSTAEGYGLPPMESLSLGRPVVVSASLPSLAGLPARGQVRLEDATAESIEAAVRQLLDDRTAMAETLAIRELSLPTWDDYAARIRDWVLAGASGVVASRATPGRTPAGP